MSACAVLAAAIALCATAGARADFPPGGTLVSTSTTTLGHDHVRLFLEPTDDVLVVWRLHGLEGSTTAAQRITPEGAIALGWPDGALGLSAQSYFFSASDDAGGAYDAYVSPDYDVRLERALAGGSRMPASGSGWAVADTSQSEWYPAVSGDGAGGAYVAWVRSLWRIYLKRVQSDGSLAPGWPATGVAVFAGDLQPIRSVALASPALLPDGAGGVYLLWLSDFPRLQRFTSSGARAPGWPPEGLTIGPGTPELFNNPLVRLIPSGAGHVIAAWTRDGSQQVFLQRIEESGAIDPAWHGGLAAVTPASSAANVLLVPDGQDGVTVAWEEDAVPRILHLLSNGTIPPGYPAGGLAPLDPAAQYVPGSLQVTTGDDGGVIVGWDDTRHSRPGIRLRWFLADGTSDPAESDTGRVATPHGTPASLRGLLADRDEGVLVAWEDGTDAASSAYRFRLSRFQGTVIVGVKSPAAPASLGLRTPWPNPARGQVSVRFTLRDPSPARIELLDLGGRSLRSMEVRGAGEQVTRIGGLGALPAGLYFIRIAQGMRTESARFAIVR
jgi:hypothetical protein